jgi:multidrug resistance efflux pump
VQRVPVKIVLDPSDGDDRPLLSLGMSVVPRVRIAGDPKDGGPLPIATIPSTQPAVAVQSR